MRSYYNNAVLLIAIIAISVLLFLLFYYCPSIFGINSQDLKFFFKSIFVPVVVATITYILFRRLDEYTKRRSQSKLGVAILESLIEEVRSGNNILIAANDANTIQQIPLPILSWSGMQTIPDEVLLRIIEVSEGIDSVGFPPREIRSHLKNYFGHMSVNWQNAITNSVDWKLTTQRLARSYAEASSSVLKMLEQSRDLLRENAYKWYPK